jgi:hypothetical protein
MILLPNQNIVQIAVQGNAQAGQRVQVYMTGFASIEAVDKILWHARLLGQLARRHALPGRRLLLSE